MAVSPPQAAPRPGWGDIDWRALATALAIGGGGGLLFATLNMPLAWLLGSMAATTVAALSPIRVAVPIRIRSLFVAVLGIMLGSAFTPELAEQAGRFAGTLLVQAGFIVLVVSTGYFTYRVIGGYDRVTAYFSSTPGGMTEMTLIGDSLGGDMRTISLNHAVRVLIVVSVIPFYFSYILGLEIGARPNTGTFAELKLEDAMILAACGIVGFMVARRFRVPAYALIGPMVVSAAVHLAGWTSGNIPGGFVATAQLVVGAAVGCRFAGISIRRMLQVAWLAAVNAMTLILLAAVVGSIAARFIDTDGSALFLSLAPGGLAEMSMIAFALDVDTAFVTVMHFMRLLLVMMLAPLAYRFLSRRGKRGPAP